MNLPHDTVTQEYIEIIAALEDENKVARVKDIAERRGVTRSSVSIALSQLAKKDLIAHEAYGHIVLTVKGRRLAHHLTLRHQAVEDLLTDILGLDKAIAEQDACKIEHLISAETYSALMRFLYLVRQCPKKHGQFIREVRECARAYSDGTPCVECMLK
ncbi:MAG TPA: metal-dependent transcriptional regulator [bacterium]|nr:metal-dependent transcriptional regulator [bacterium]